MKELKCLNCNSKDMEYIGGIWVCQNCGSKFIPDKDEKPEEDAETVLTKRLVQAYNKKIGLDYIVDNAEPKWEKALHKLLKCEDEIDYCVNRILKINDRNTYVMTILAIKQISYGKGTREEADAVVNCYYDVLKNAPSEEIRFEIVKVIKSAPFHRHEYLQLNPDLAPIVKEIEEMLGEE